MYARCRPVNLDHHAAARCKQGSRRLTDGHAAWKAGRQGCRVSVTSDLEWAVWRD